jgi:tetratricopeptide (TPR) repeat protein
VRTAAANAIMISARYEKALELARRAHALSVGANPHQRMHATWPIISARYHLGRWEEALAVVDEHVEAFRQDPATGCSFVRDGPIIGAAILAHRGELDRARALAALVGEPTNLATASAWQARFATASGDPETARRISEDKARERRLYGEQHLVALLEALAALEDWPAVVKLLPEARARMDGNALLGPVSDRVEGLAHAQAGRSPEDGRALRRALAGFERLGDPFEAARTREHLAAVTPAQEARSLLEAARATYERLACAPRERAVRARLDRLA